MNKQELIKELIDEAVRDNDGKWPHSRGTVLNVAGRNNSSYTPFVSFDFGATERQDDMYWVTLCTKEEFQQRARELGYGVEVAEHESWYCYETQKALRLPPAGSEILYDDSKYFVVAHHGKRADDVIASTGEDYGELIYLCWRKAKPIDYNRKAEAERKRAINHLYFKYPNEVDEGGMALLELLYDAGFLRIPEDK